MYTTTLNTITRDPNSMLGIMFSGRQKIAQDSKGNYFIDRDGALFRYVLNFLRSWELCLPQSFDDFEQLSVEADFYQVDDLIKALQILREDRRKNKPSSEHQMGTIIVSERPTEYLIRGRLELVDEIFKKYVKGPVGNTLEGYVEYPVHISSMAVAFDLLQRFGFQLESCINRSIDNCQYIFMRKK